MAAQVQRAGSFGVSAPHCRDRGACVIVTIHASVSVSKETGKRAIDAVLLDRFHVNIKRGFLPSLPPTCSSCVRLNTIIVLIPEVRG